MCTQTARTMARMNTTVTPPIPWQRIVADVADALIYADREGIIRAWNPAATALFRFSEAETLGQSLDLIIPEHLREAHWRGFDRAIQRGSCSREVRTTRGTHKDGRKLYVDMSFSVVTDGAGQSLGSAAMARDVTARYLAELERRKAGG